MKTENNINKEFSEDAIHTADKDNYDSILDDYIDWSGICDDFNLKHGDISPHQTQQLQIILSEFIKQNK
jgi:hypothetical protein